MERFFMFLNHILISWDFHKDIQKRSDTSYSFSISEIGWPIFRIFCEMGDNFNCNVDASLDFIIHNIKDVVRWEQKVLLIQGKGN